MSPQPDRADFRISALIPAYNAAPYLAEAIQSVLDQTYLPAEIVVLDDGSTDDTYRIARRFGRQIRLLGPQRRGFVASRNHLIDQASYEWIAFHDADDLWLPNKLALQVDYLREHPEAHGCLGHAEQVLQPGCSLPSGFRQTLMGEPTAQFFIPNLLASRDVYRRVGPFGMDDPTGSDSDWFVRAKDAGIVVGVVAEVLYRRRWHDSNLSYQFGFNRNMLDILRRSVVRTDCWGGFKKEPD